MIAEHYNFPSATDDTFSTFPPEEYKKQWPQYVLKLQDVLLGPYGTIYDEKRKLIAGANYNYSFWNDGVPSPASPLDAQQEKYLKAPSLPQKVVDLPGDINYIYAHHYFNIYVYGHLHDTLQDLSKIEQLGLSACKLITSPFTSHVILKGDEPLEQHITLFRNAKTIIGAHGALFKNLIFCEDNPVIVEFNPSSLNNPCYAEGLALSAGLTNYNYILSESDEQHNSTIDIDKLKRILD